jgi:uncharacterized tellurite resistance protein B-like protein
MMAEKNEALLRVHGVSPEHTPEDRLAVGKALLIVLGAGTALSPREMGSFVSIATTYGATPEEIEAWRRFDHARARLADHLQVEPRLARHLLYDVIRICRTDGVYAARERAKVSEAARLLGVSPTIVASLEAVTEIEGALVKARAALQVIADQRPKGAVPGAVAGLKEITEQEASIRRTRISTMEDDHGIPPP